MLKWVSERASTGEREREREWKRERSMGLANEKKVLCIRIIKIKCDDHLHNEWYLTEKEIKKRRILQQYTCPHTVSFFFLLTPA